MTDAEFLIGIARTAALADNGHDSWHPEDGAWLPDRRAPMRFFWFPDALVVARAAPAQQDLLGARVTAIDGHSPDEFFERLRSLAGGPDNYRRWNLNLFLERAELLHALGLAEARDRLSVSLVLRDGSEVTREIAMIPRTAGAAWRRAGPISLGHALWPRNGARMEGFLRRPGGTALSPGSRSPVPRRGAS